MNLNKLISIQKSISEKIVLKPFILGEKFTAAAFDISFDTSDTAYGACVVVNEKMTVIEERYIKSKTNFPYLPTFLAFREIPVMRKLYRMIESSVDIIIIDGNGTIHPRRCGIAVHFGVTVNKPTLGVSKSYLYGRFTEPDNKKFATSHVYDKNGDIVGTAIRTKLNTKPIFVSPGNLIDFNSSIEILKRLISKYRLPDPLRIAHIQANRFRLSFFKDSKKTS